MFPCIADEARVVVKVGPFSCLVPLTHGVVVLFRSDSMDIPLIKAVRGIPGDLLGVRDGQVIVNNAVVRNSEGQTYRLSAGRAAMIDLYAHDYGGVILPEMYLVMGEDPAGTTDSSRFGLVRRDQIIGKVIERSHE